MAMTTNTALQKVYEFQGLRGFSNLFRKENRIWWGTRRWWINALIWPVILCGLMANMLFVPTIGNLATDAEIARAGGLTAHVVEMGLSVFFEFGITALAIGIVILSQDMIINEKQSGVAEWLLAKPVARRAYLLAKLAANIVPVLVLLIGVPSALAYGMLSLRIAEPFPLIDFVPALGIMVLHTFFYLSLTILLGTIFNNRGPILGIALASVLGGTILGGFVKPLLSVTPWMLPKLASLVAADQPIPLDTLWAPLIASMLWSLIFIVIAIVQFEKTEF
jgi:ABC-2 type transport system permease protein